MDPLSELPIEDDAPKRSRRLKGSNRRRLRSLAAAGGLAFIAVLGWLVLSDEGGDEPETTPTSSTTSTTPPPTTTFDLDLPAPPRSSLVAREASVEPARGLTDGVVVTVTADSPYLTREQPSLALCRRGRAVACTDVETGPVTVSAESSFVQVTLMRQFVDWQGNVQDCATLAPCELRMRAFGNLIEELNIEIEFDDSAPLMVSRQSTVDDVELGEVAELNITVPTRRVLVARQCIVGLNDSCAAGATIAPSQLTTTDSAAVYRAFPRRYMTTARGPHDCVIDGACELRFITEDSQRIEPVGLNFLSDEDDVAGGAGLSVRPNSGLADREVIEVRLSNAAASRASLWLCAADVPTCVPLTTSDTDESTLISIPRFIDDRYDRLAGEAIIDCAMTPCSLTAAVGGEFVSVPISFDTTESPAADAEVGIDGSGPFESGDEIRLVGRGLFVNAALNDPFVSTRIRFCESPAGTPADCVSTAGFSTGIQRDGTVDAILQIPNFDRRRTIALDALAPVSFCLDSCWLIVETRLEVPGVIIPIDIIERG